MVRGLHAQGCAKTGDPRIQGRQIDGLQLVVLAFAYDSRTRGNVATEIVKYFLQLHYGIKDDFRSLDLLVRGNFYGELSR